MNVIRYQFESGWTTLSLGMTKSELKKLIEMFEMLGDEKIGHFHIRSDFEGQPTIGDIEFSLVDNDHDRNMYLP